MKKTFLIIAVMIGCAHAQTTTTITGTLKDLTNTVVTSGKVVFTLTPSRDTTISGIARFTPGAVTCLLNGSGQIKAQDGVSTCTVTKSTALSPSGSSYTTCYWPYNVKTACFNFYAVLDTYDWSTVVPTPTTSPAQNFVDIFSTQTIGGNKTFTGNMVETGTATFSGLTSLTGGVSGILFPGDYTFSVKNGVIQAFNNTTGQVQFSGTDLTVVWNQVASANASVGGQFTFNDGIYNISSFIQETLGAYANFYYAVGLPSTPTGSWVQWRLKGSSRAAAAFNYDSTSPTNSLNSGGVIFNVTQAALNTLSNSNIAQIVWQRPDPSFFFTNEDTLENIAFRFPSNQRGSEFAVNLWAASSLEWDNLLADFNATYSNMLNGSLPAAGSYGFASSFGSAGNLQHMKNVVAVGYETGFDLEGEHVVADTLTSAICKNAGKIGRTTASINPSLIYHPILIEKFTDQTNQNGWILGPELAAGTQIDFIGLDVEKITTTNFARVNNMVETTPGNSSGIVTLVGVTANVGINADAAFTTGGGNFTIFGSNGTLSIPQVTSFAGVAAVNSGLPHEIAQVTIAAQAAATTNHALFTPAASGLYRVTMTAKVTQVASVSSTLGGATGFSVAYTDATDSTASVVQSQTGAVSAGNALTSATTATVQISAKVGVPVTFSYGYTSSGSPVMNYQMSVLVEAF